MTTVFQLPTEEPFGHNIHGQDEPVRQPIDSVHEVPQNTRQGPQGGASSYKGMTLALNQPPDSAWKVEAAGDIPVRRLMLKEPDEEHRKLASNE